MPSSTIAADGEPRSRQRCVRVFRFAFILSAAMPGMLPRIKLELGGNKTLVLRLPKKLADLSGERVEKRLVGLANELGRSGKIVIG